MSRFRHIIDLCLARRDFVLAGALLLALFSLQESAQAGCGDYVFFRDAQGRLVRPSSLMKGHAGEIACRGPNCPDNNPLAVPRTTVPSPGEEGLPGKFPCHGPNCSSESQLPFVPVPASAPLRSSQESTALLWKQNEAGPEEDPRFVHPSSTSGDELHIPRSIFHPPR